MDQQVRGDKMKSIAIIATLLFLVSCSEKRELSKKDIELARCLCTRDGKELQTVRRSSNKYITFTCTGGAFYIHYGDSYSEGCSK